MTHDAVYFSRPREYGKGSRGWYVQRKPVHWENSSDLFDQAEGFYGEYKLSGQDDTYNWDYKTPALAVLFANLSAARPELGGSLSQWQTEAERYFDNIIDGESSGTFTDGR